MVVPLPSTPFESSKLQTRRSFFVNNPWELSGTIEIERGPWSPFLASTVDPMTTSFVSFFRIDVVSAGRLWLAATLEVCNAGYAPSLVGTACAAQPDVTRSITVAGIIDR